MKIHSLIFLVIFTQETRTQSNSDFQPTARGGHFIVNGRYQQERPQIPNNFNYHNNQQPQNFYPNQQQPQTSNNVIGNTAENTFGSAAVNSIVGSRFSDGSAVNSIVGSSLGSANNVIGNRATNTQGGAVNSVIGNPL